MGRITSIGKKTIPLRVGTVFAVTGALYASSVYQNNNGEAEPIGREVGTDIRQEVAPVVGDTLLGGFSLLVALVGEGNTDADSSVSQQVSESGYTIQPGDHYWKILGNLGMSDAEIAECDARVSLSNQPVLIAEQTFVNPC